jgi:ubiquinone biosynthesis accessory factor UbiJ
MPATPAWLASIEAVLNRNIQASSSAGDLARRLDNTSLRVDIDGVTSVRAALHAGRLALLAGAGESADAVISGSPPALLGLLTGTGNRPQSQGSVKITGDAEIAAGYRDLFAAARPDVEEELARLIGDVPARRLSLIAQKAVSWARQVGRSFGENLAEYLQEEGRDLVNKTELDEYLRGVDELRESADRFDARLARLEQRLVASP